MDEGGETPKVLAETPEEKLNEFLARIRRLSEGHQDPVDPTKLNPEKLEAELGNKLTAVATDLRNIEVWMDFTKHTGKWQLKKVGILKID